MTKNWIPKGRIAILLGLFLHSLTFLYVNKPKLFWLYLIVTTATPFIDAVFGSYFRFAVPLVCAAHAFYIARRGPVISHRGWFSKWWGLIPCVFVFIVVIDGLVMFFLYESSGIKLDAMQPTLNISDTIIVSKLGYPVYTRLGVSSVNGKVASTDLMQRGKLYAFMQPRTDRMLVSRLIAVPGDSIAIENDSVILNGTALPMNLTSKTEQLSIYEQQLGEHSYQIQKSHSVFSRNFTQIEIPEKSYFFLGDNRDNANVYHHWGLVNINRIAGEVVLYPSKPK